MRRAYLRFAVLSVCCATVASAGARQAQTASASAILAALNEILPTHAYNTTGPRLELRSDGAIVRKNFDGTIFTFTLSDIGEMSIDREGEAHVLLPCKDGARCVERREADGERVQQIPMVVFSVYPAESGADVLRLLRELQTALAVRKDP